MPLRMDKSVRIVLDDFCNGIHDDERQQIEMMQAQQGLLNQQNGGGTGEMPLARDQGIAGGILFTYTMVTSGMSQEHSCFPMEPSKIWARSCGYWECLHLQQWLRTVLLCTTASNHFASSYCQGYQNVLQILANYTGNQSI